MADHPMDPKLAGHAAAVGLRLLAQILVKLYAGPQWGLDEEGILWLTKEAEICAKAMERGKEGRAT